MAASCRNRTRGILERQTPRSPLRLEGSAGGDDDDVLEYGAVYLERVAPGCRRVQVKGIFLPWIDHMFVEGGAHPASR